LLICLPVSELECSSPVAAKPINKRGDRRKIEIVMFSGAERRSPWYGRRLCRVEYRSAPASLLIGSSPDRRNPQRTLRLPILRQSRLPAPVRGGAGSLRWGALLGLRDPQAEPHGPADPTGLRQTVRQTPEKRCRRCQGDLRGGAVAEHALCRGRTKRSRQTVWCSGQGSRIRSSELNQTVQYGSEGPSLRKRALGYCTQYRGVG